ncbi:MULTISPECIES: hypothetical protein [Streptomyces]|uniref:hypothetical protein n=1 Tax=Streptomyces TaxID=1883 RepID=UPI0013DD309F|nr:hypothetical protein [Streptomyces sp. SID8016]
MSWRIGPASSPATVARPVTYTDIAAPMPEARLRQAKRPQRDDLLMSVPAAMLRA